MRTVVFPFSFFYRLIDYPNADCLHDKLKVRGTRSLLMIHKERFDLQKIEYAQILPIYLSLCLFPFFFKSPCTGEYIANTRFGEHYQP